MPSRSAGTPDQSLCLPAWTLGETAYSRLPQLAAPYGNRFLLAGGRKALRAGQARLIGQIAGSSLELAGLRLYGKDCTWAAAERLAGEALSLRVDFLCAMGGGRALDTVKAAGDMAGLPVFTLPTIAATCAAVTRLSVLYDEAGHFERFLYLKEAPRHCLIDPSILAGAPAQFLRAGLGDSLAKHVETLFSSRGAPMSHADALGLSIAAGLYGQIHALGAQAILDNRAGRDSEALRQAALINIISTGCVSLLVSERFNGALAHALYYALEPLAAARGLLHGDFVAYGALVLLVLDGETDKARDLLGLLGRLGIPASLRQMGLRMDDPDFRACLEQVRGQQDMRDLPYPISGEMIREALLQTEAMAGEEAALV